MNEARYDNRGTGIAPGTHKEVMHMANQEKRELTPEEIEQQNAEEMPDREEMSLVNANVAAPVNLAAALNVLSDDSTATANAVQYAPIDQSTT
jgi:hypothetical protein